MQLKGKQYTDHPWLDRVEEFDEASRGYGVVERLDSPQPRSFTWRCKIHLDQKNEGSCVGFACGHELIARPVEVLRIRAPYARGIYKDAQRHFDKWPGEAYSGTSILAGAKVLKHRGWITGYYWGFGLQDLIIGVGHVGPALLGLRWMTGMRRPDKRGFIRASGKVRGGHAILCKGVNLKGRYFVLHNSWGKRWGQNGDCKISFSDMERLLAMNGECCFPTGRKMLR